MFWKIFISFVFYFHTNKAVRMKEQITVPFSQPELTCIRLLNGSTSVGCQSDRYGSMGAVALIKEVTDLSEEYNNLPYGISKIVVVISAEHFTKEIICAIGETNFVTGILLIAKDNMFPSSFSEDSICPNKKFNFYTKFESQQRTCRWNEKGALLPDGFLFLSLNKPLFVLTSESDINLVLNKCYNTFNHNRRESRCMARLLNFMSGAGNAEICQRRQDYSASSHFSSLQPSLCDPLQDYNVFAMLPPRNAANISKPKIFMLATRMDIATIFSGSSGGDVSVLTSIIALLAVANSIGRNLTYFYNSAMEQNRQLLISFFHGESMGYIGSSRMVYEMGIEQFPAKKNAFSNLSLNVQQIALNDLWLFFEVQQLRASKNFHLHTSSDVYERNSTLLDSVVNSLRQSITQEEFGVQFHKNSSFPPSSYHSIRRKTTKVPGLLLTSYGDSYDSGQINSLADLEISQNPREKSQNLRYFSTAANAILTTVIEQVLKRSEAKEKFYIDDKYIEELMDCFFYSPNWDCRLFRTILDYEKMSSSARSMSIGTGMTLSTIREVVHSLLVKSLGETKFVQNVETQSQCEDFNKNQNVHYFVWQNDTETEKARCYKSPTHYTLAKSPAFSNKSKFKSGEYSTWMESTWSKAQFELYLKANIRLDAFAAFTAFVVVLASIPLKVFMRESWFIDSHEPPATVPHQL